MTKICIKHPLFASSLLVLAACATATISQSPIDIASNSVRRVDPVSGKAEILAPDVTLKTKRRSVKANTRLRTAGDFTDRNGIVQKEGAFLDIAVWYATATPRTEEGRYYDQVVYPGGQLADLVDFGQTILECRDDYTRDYPRYFGNYGYYGYGYGYGYGYDALGYYWGQWFDGYNDWDDDDHDDDDDDDDDDGHVGRPDTDGHPRPPSRPYPVRPEVRPDPDVDPPLPRPPRLPHARAKVGKRVIYEPASAHKSRPTRRPMDRPMVRPRPSAGAHALTPASRYVTETRPSVSRPTPRPVSKPRPTPQKAIDRVFAKTENPRTSRSDEPRPNLNYYPGAGAYGGYMSESYRVRHKCRRQENLRVFIPKQRIEAARDTGLVVYLQPR
ncbi:MAG TPA: hypothetical protein ENJ42_03535, partial [Hellea balneolensis]|nr:hypothetical protein [Hellea balneolensis]